jgi:hypothetical protein
MGSPSTTVAGSRRIDRVAEALLSSGRLSGPEVLCVAVTLSLIAGAVFGSHLKDGGFYNDDWRYYDDYAYPDTPGFFGAVGTFSWTWSRPVQMLYWPLTQAAFGLDTGLHLAWALFTAVIMSALLYTVLRTLGLERIHSAAIASLVLIFPASDATRLWSAASIVNVGISLYLAGTLVALQALRYGGRRGVLLHAVAECLYVLSLLTYEVAAVAILLSILAYRRRADWRRAARRWLADVVATALTLGIFTSNTFYEPQPVLELPIRAASFASDAAVVVAEAVVPSLRTAGLIALLLMVLLAGAGALKLRGLRPGRERAELRRWLLVAAAAVIATAAGYAMFLPSTYLDPLDAGQENRTNALAAFGVVALIYSLLMVAGTLMLGIARRPARLRATFAVAVTVLIGAGYVDKIDSDKADWARAWREQRQVVATIREAVGRPPPRSVIFSFGQRTQAAAGVPVFGAPWDLTGSLKAEWRDGTISAHPMLPRTSVACRRRELAAPNWDGTEQTARYGRAIFVDVISGRSARIGDRATCVARSRQLRSVR